MQTVLNIIYFLNLVIILEIAFSRKKSIESSIAWIMCLMIVPLGGFITYNLVGRGIRKNKRFNFKKNEEKAFKEKFMSKHLHIKSDNIYIDSTVDKHNDMVNMLMMSGNAALTEGNSVNLYSDSNEFFSNLLKELENAEHSINIQFYIFKDDTIGKQIIEILERKLSEGVSVRVLYDAMGSRWLKTSTLKRLKSSGAETAAFFKLFNFKFNNRNHRKIVVVDGKVGFIGGFNIGDEYLGRYKRFGAWRDTHLKIEGPAVKFLNIQFLQDWRFASNTDIDLTKYLSKRISPKGDVSIQIVSSGPDSPEEQIKYGYLKMIQSAKQYIYIQSPYFILDKSLLEALKLAIYQGVDVRVMIPAKPDHPFVYWASYSYAGELLKIGCKVYTYSKDAFLHAKTVVIDDEVCSVGTANMDIRSFSLNFEINSFMYSKSMAIAQRRAFKNDIKVSNEVTLAVYNRRSLIIKIKEAISRLLSPML